ncbi:MAG TPA: 3-oxoacyl-[acyl-carrier-protein] reductase [Saprospiraceae bacterium]|jgi:3-oxoacyl-[acyl-carrier protein] reductase|nr:3-oxoacyl-[acyl-carrier-protein] reductase [Saprospiraceae bacterium]HMT69086.1 3-oxoacyl-[acyl-carrier-protein] reductase [Saprospiraceae bacterium]HQV66246.1 3-oxoacyl-[acyl-carrier-protein] reductase [Saprospiraceae bacterium]HRG40964.1 3-oxoacyl-[acyl-carrier-protein] reductase [Saprospiraceae bacterium]
MRTLDGRIAIVTGGSSGLGKATLIKFASLGATVINWDINQERGEALVNELKTKGYTTYFFRLNTANYDDVNQAATNIIGQFGKIDILVNNAGITRDATLLKMTNDHWQQVIDVNLTGVFNCTKAVSPYMVDKGYGRIISISSVVGLFGNFGQTNYAAAKAGVIAMTKTWAKELGRKGINVNAVAPGFIRTEILDAMPEEALDKMKAKVPLQKLGNAEDIANVNAFLASDEADYINGATISVDGGISL